MTPLVRFADVSKVFGDTSVPTLTHVTFEIQPRARIALIGPSGSGKSTILSLIAGLDTPSAGTVSWPGLATPLLPTQIGLAFQGASLIPWLNVEQNVLLPLQIAGGAMHDEPLGGLLGSLGVESLVEKLPEEISGGQAQRVGLARAMVTTPKLLLADEPSGQLDRGTSEVVVEALLRWCEATGCALLLATHDPDIAAELPGLWSLEHGRLLEIPN
jgi:ABC-type nitrate/sulfonate/bicarbonate transport system ATPase subunit